MVRSCSRIVFSWVVMVALMASNSPRLIVASVFSMLVDGGFVFEFVFDSEARVKALARVELLVRIGLLA